MSKYPELKTIRDFIRFATSQFNEAGLYYGHGTDNAWDEATALVLHTLHLSHHMSPTLLEANLVQQEQKVLLKLIADRIHRRIPVAYLTHEAWFAGLSFYVDERVLIPRSPIAELIENHFSPWILAKDVHQILDLCTGCGCIGIACAKAFPEATVDASDISRDALAIAKINILRHNVEDQIQLIESDLFQNIPQKKYDLIVSNPPYVSAQELSELHPEYLHEPKLGLKGGEIGLDFAIPILQQAHQFLSPKGVLVVEVGNSDQALINHFPKFPFTWLEFERGGGGVFLLTAEQLNSQSLQTQNEPQKA